MRQVFFHKQAVSERYLLIGIAKQPSKEIRPAILWQAVFLP